MHAAFLRSFKDKHFVLNAICDDVYQQSRQRYTGQRGESKVI